MIKAREYVKAESLSEAWELNQKKSSVILGGMMWLKMSSLPKGTLIDLSGLGLDTIEETEEEFRIGCMCTLRQLELHEGLNQYFNGVFKECTRHIVGVQFRNGATAGGSVFGRYGFSDILTCLMALDTSVELYQGGIVPIAEFPLIACCAARKGSEWYFSVGARPARAELVAVSSAAPDPEEIAERFSYGDNVRGSGEYRRELAKIYLARLIKGLKEA